jgi:hypothetical protein
VEQSPAARWGFSYVLGSRVANLRSENYGNGSHGRSREHRYHFPEPVVRVSVSLFITAPEHCARRGPAEPRSVEYVSRTLAVGAAMAPGSIIFGPQNCGAVAQTLPAKGRLQDDPRLFGYFNAFWLPSDRSNTDTERVGDPK